MAGSGIGNVVELKWRAITGTQSRGTRRRLIGVLRSDGTNCVSHPNGHVGWTRDLAKAGRAVIHYPNGAGSGICRDAARTRRGREQIIRSTGQHPFPGNLVYRLGRRHVRAVGVYFRRPTRTCAPVKLLQRVVGPMLRAPLC